MSIPTKHLNRHSFLPAEVTVQYDYRSQAEVGPPPQLTPYTLAQCTPPPIYTPRDNISYPSFPFARTSAATEKSSGPLPSFDPFPTQAVLSPTPWSMWDGSPSGVGTSMESSAPSGLLEPCGFRAFEGNSLATDSCFPHPYAPKDKIRHIFPPMGIAVPSGEQATPIGSCPAHVESRNQTHKDVNVSGPQYHVPQSVYEPHSEGDKKRYVSLAKLQPPIIFHMHDSPDRGVPVSRLLSRRQVRVTGGDEPVLTSCGPSICIRINWPGYQPFHKQIQTRDYTRDRGRIKKEKLARDVARCINRYVETISKQKIQAGVDKQWRVGPSYIQVDDIILDSLHHVSQGSWQPQLRLRRIVGGTAASVHQHQGYHGTCAG